MHGENTRLAQGIDVAERAAQTVGDLPEFQQSSHRSPIDKYANGRPVMVLKVNCRLRRMANLAPTIVQVSVGQKIGIA
jgi:hypothetical protein